MRNLRQGCIRQQLQFLQRQYLQDGETPLESMLSDSLISRALAMLDGSWNDRIYTPLVTLWLFLGQVISADHSCRAAVARLIAHRVSQGLSACSARTGAYCQARMRLPEKFFATIARTLGRQLEDQAEEKWLWKGRHVYMFDGTTVNMPDTPKNQAAYPQVYNQKPGLGFPIARVCTIISLSCGAVMDVGFSRYAGKGQGELSLLRKMWGILSPGDVLLTDALMSTWYEMLMLKQRGIDSVSRLNKAHRRADFRRGKRLGKGDHIVRWYKPSPLRAVDAATYKTLPDYIEIRETRVQVVQPGFRTFKGIIVVTTLLDPEAATPEDLAGLYRSRWSQELDIRDLKVTLGMDFLRCKTPELVRKEIWTHILVCNLVRTVTAQAALRHDIEPRAISFKGAVQTLQAFQPLINFQGYRGPSFRSHLYQQLLDSIVLHRVADRPDRFEPRFKKRRAPLYRNLNLPRHEAKLLMLKRRTKI